MVIANYSSNDEAAKKFSEKNGIDAVKFDVGNYNECLKAIKGIENKYGQISILINNAGITRDAALHKMTLQQWNDVINTNLNSAFNLVSSVIGKMRDSGFEELFRSFFWLMDRKDSSGKLIMQQQNLHC